MSNEISVFDLDNWHSSYGLDREYFYEEQVRVFKKTGSPTRASETIDIFVFDPHGEILIQERSYQKSFNPNLLDKIGGHVQFGDSPERTLLLETVQEVQIPSFVSHTGSFVKDLAIFKPYINTVCYCKCIGVKTRIFPKLINGELIDIAQKKHIFLGVYDGTTKLVDKEAQGLSYFSLDRLQQEIDTNPERFTTDIRILIEAYEDEIVDFIQSIKNS